MLLAMTVALTDAPSRGPVDHAVRDQIISTASEYFAHYGYAKTSVADLGRELGFSKTYIYRFFESKQAIGEEICAMHLAAVLEHVQARYVEGISASDRFALFFGSIVERTSKLLGEDRRIYEIAVTACLEDWKPALAYVHRLQDMIVDIVQYGRDRGEFETRTPVSEIAPAIFFAMTPFIEPAQFERNRKFLPEAQKGVLALILRSLEAK